MIPPLSEPPSFQTLLAPLLEVNNNLSYLLYLQWRLLTLSDLLMPNHPVAANALLQATIETQRAVQYFQNQKWMLMLTLRQELQVHMRQFGSWPALGLQEHFPL